MKIEEMEEKEQVLQARIEALQADNDFTNERLAALQGTSGSRLNAVCSLKPSTAASLHINGGPSRRLCSVPPQLSVPRRRPTGAAAGPAERSLSAVVVVVVYSAVRAAAGEKR